MKRAKRIWVKLILVVMLVLAVQSVAQATLIQQVCAAVEAVENKLYAGPPIVDNTMTMAVNTPGVKWVFNHPVCVG